MKPPIASTMVPLTASVFPKGSAQLWDCTLCRPAVTLALARPTLVCIDLRAEAIVVGIRRSAAGCVPLRGPVGYHYCRLDIYTGYLLHEYLLIE